jgi:integrase
MLSAAGSWTTARELPDVAGNVARRPDGKWRARYRDGAGKEHAKHFDRKSDAERWLAAAQVALNRGEWVDPSLSRVTVEEWAKIWLDGLSHLKPTTRTRYTSILGAHVLPRWGKTPLARVAHGDVVVWVGELSRSGLAASSVRQTHRVFALILDLAVRDGRLPRNPASGVKLPRPAKANKRYLTHEEVARLARACPPPHDLVVLVLAYTGLRWGELAGLRAGDLRLGTRRLLVAQAMAEVNGRAVYGTPKNHQRREVPVPAFLIDRLKQQAAGKQPTDLLFTGPKGGVLRNHFFRRTVFDDAARRARLEGLTPHELRHTAASLAVAAGANVKAVQRMLGHASAAMTLDVYAGLFGDDLDVVATNLDLAARAAAIADQVRTSELSNPPPAASPRQ